MADVEAKVAEGFLEALIAREKKLHFRRNAPCDCDAHRLRPNYVMVRQRAHRLRKNVWLTMFEDWREVCPDEYQRLKNMESLWQRVRNA